MSRTDDIINVAGHRLSTGGMEEVLAAHKDVAECAVIGVVDELKGEVPCGFIVLKAGVNRPVAEIEQECIALVREKIVPLADVPFATVEADDGTVFPAPRVPFLRAWTSARGHIGRALVRDGSLAAWGVIRPCRSGRRIGPLVADDRAAAEAVFAALLAADGAGEVFLDVPSVNSEAVALAHDHGLTPVFETARMYTGAIRPVRLERVFGVTTFELG
jgi:hypothetical protein